MKLDLGDDAHRRESRQRAGIADALSRPLAGRAGFAFDQDGDADGGAAPRKRPKIVKKEITVHLLAYNLVQAVMAQAAFLGRVLPR